MGARQILLLVLNVLVTVKLFTPFLPLLQYLAAGYVLVLHAAVVRPRLGGRAATFVPALSLVCWTGMWFVFKQGLDRLPSLGLTGIAPDLVGASYIYLKVYDLIRRVQNGAPAPGLVQYVTQMTFFPSYVAGPIAGPEPFAQGLAPTRASVALGLNRLIGGILKLYVVAPFLEPANLLGQGYPYPRFLAQFISTRDVWVGVYGSSLWIYFNFAGYTDIAIALGLFMGVALPENFDAPYLAPNPSEFWQRWHMSFTSWLREHVFSPVSRLLVARGQGGTILALVVGTTATMLACGLWHRVSLSFLVWGGYHALVVIAHQIYATRWKPRLAKAGLATFFAGRAYRMLGTLATFHAVTIGWVFFLPVDAPLRDHLAILGRLVGL
ncbi:MAG TPA: MBOAT family O-acyltransferase [Planctomycetota bacterium]|nr:MBOAT family O-acyltransferase [Planctomycetota bacterium]